jgi:hypothetical protein
MLSAAQELEQKTQRYWQISRVWNNIDNDIIEMGDAIKDMNGLMYTMNPARPITRFAKQLRAELIRGSGRDPVSETRIFQLPIRTA